MSDSVAYLKFALAYMAAALWVLAEPIEPDKAIWLLCIAGSCLGVLTGEDRSMREVVVHVFLGIITGVVISQLLKHYLGAPQKPVSLFCGLFGATITLRIGKKLQTGGLDYLLDRFIGSKKT